MTDVLILALALSMDAFAVSLGLGSKRPKKTRLLALVVATYFGLFQGLMPVVGFLGGKGMLTWVDGFSHWVAFILLIMIGAKMVYEAMSEGIEDDIAQITHRIILVLAIATSIDAMAAGFTLNLLDVNPLVACTIIGVTTFICSYIGVLVGAKSGARLESKAELLGGVILIIIGFKMLLF